MKYFRNLSLQGKISLIYIVANVLVLISNIMLLAGINSMSGELDLVYRDNLQLNELVVALDDVQNSMTDYLNAKTSDSLEEYYRSEQIYREKIQVLNEDVTDLNFARMERNIKAMSESYLDVVSQTVEAKRGRNVEKYRVRYENATTMYEYIKNYIASLNNAQFMHNSSHYKELSEAFRFFETASLIIIFVVMLCSMTVIIRLAGAIVSPLKKLARQADEVAKGNFDVALSETDSTDEIGVVTGAFNQMVVSIRNYIEKIRESMEVERELKEKELLMETHLKDAQLKYLQAQINPHFLFNTLNAGAQLAMMEDAERTYQYVQNMAEFFRYNVKKGEETVTIREEMELIDNYIYILNVRFSGEIQYEKEADEELLDVKMPSMILQPLVENAVNHGIREMAGEGKIKVHVYKENEEVCISIKDNGKGMTQSGIESVLDGTYRADGKTASNGVGMDNVIARLKLFTGSEEVISIYSEGKNMGTEIVLYLPYEEQEDSYV